MATTKELEERVEKLEASEAKREKIISEVRVWVNAACDALLVLSLLDLLKGE